LLRHWSAVLYNLSLLGVRVTATWVSFTALGRGDGVSVVGAVETTVLAVTLHSRSGRLIRIHTPLAGSRAYDNEEIVLVISKQ
jgi:hypothetical protein